MATPLKTFHWADYLVFGGFMAFMLGIGVFYGIMGRRKKASTKEYLNASRSLSILPVSMSLLSAFLSAILILGTPAEVYTRGTMYWMYTIGMMTAAGLAAAFFVPLLYPLQLTSSYEYLEERFNSKSAKLTGTLILVVMQLLYMGVCLFSPATALEAVTGFPVWASIVLGGVIAIIYTALGGMKAAVWTSVLQTAIMAAGVIAVIIQGSIEVGGIGEIWRLNYESDRIEFFDFDPNPLKRHTFWNLAVGGTIGWLSTYGVNQASVQRFSSVPTLNKARITVLLNVPGLLFFVSICALSGMAIFATYAKEGCDPLKAGLIDNPNQLMPFFVMDKLGIPGIPGIFLACLFSGSLSTMSSSLGALSAVTWKDVLSYKLGHLSGTKQVIITQLLVIIYGGAGIGMAFMAQNLGGTVLQASLSFTGAAGGPLLGLFLLGGWFPCANWLGAVIGGIVGLAFPIWISIGAYITKPFYPLKPVLMHNCSAVIGGNWTLPNITGPDPRLPEDMVGIERLYLLSYLWFPAIGTFTVVVLGLIVSCLTGLTNPKDVKHKYHLPLFDRILCCLPNSTLKVLRYGYPEVDPQEILEETEAKQALDMEADLSEFDTGKDNTAFEKDGLEKDGKGSPPAYSGTGFTPYQKSDVKMRNITSSDPPVIDGYSNAKSYPETDTRL